MIELKNGRGYGLVRAEGEAAAKRATLYIYDVVGFDPWTGGGVTAKRVIDDLATAPDAELDVRINSPGGEVSEGIAIYNALARHGAKVTVHVDALAASIASVVAMAGDEIRISESALFMVHQPWTFSMGDAPEMRRVADMLDKYWSSILSTYARRTGRRAETITKRVDDAGGEWWLTAEEAVAQGFADVVVAPEKDTKAQAFGTARFARAPARIAASADPAAAAAPRQAPALVELAAPRATRPAAPDVEGQAARRRAVAVHRLS
jgi:ATP-dependent protease ClpP protease subunit